jgi:beta-glucosidase
MTLRTFRKTTCAVAILIMTANISDVVADDSVEQRVNELLAQMSTAEKIGQMRQANASYGHPPDYLGDDLRSGRLGSILNLADVDTINELQRIAVEESRLGIPLLVGRDVIHGFKTILPIPLAQAATWNPELVEKGARVAATEAASYGINWTFAPMVDVTRDPRWGRIAESPGEDPFLTSALAVAMVRGFQGDDLAARNTIAACAKHFAGYGAVESGRDYATTNIPENELRNVYLKPFKAAVDAGVTTLMASFSDLNGVPATGNSFLMRQVLRDEWGFDGFVVSDWDSIHQLSVHGLTEGDRESAHEAAAAGIDMEMAGKAYDHLQDLVDDGRIGIDVIDAAARNILRIKFRLGLFDHPYVDPDEFPAIANEHALRVARQAALESIVLLRNEDGVLPLRKDQVESLAVIGPLADAPYEQLGTWIFDGDESLSVTGLEGIQDLVGDDTEIRYVRAMETSRSRTDVQFEKAVAAARKSDAVVLFLGEESILSGEAHSRADINLPGAQAELVREVRKAGKPVIAVVLAGRPLTLTNIVDEVDAILFAWHPGTMGGPAIADVLFGVESPSGKLPVSFPRMVGQIPTYYSQKNTGKPPSPETTVHIDEIPVRAPQTSFGMTAFHLDAGYEPMWEFGFGLSYASFEYGDIAASAAEIRAGETIKISAELRNTGKVPATETAQLYVRDLVGNVTRPVRELKGFTRVRLEPGEVKRVEFQLHTDDLAFFGRENTLIIEPGEFHAWIGGSSGADLRTEFRVVE